jgi:hypothetical protein
MEENTEGIALVIMFALIFLLLLGEFALLTVFQHQVGSFERPYIEYAPLLAIGILGLLIIYVLERKR